MKKLFLAGASVLAMTVASHAADVRAAYNPITAAPASQAVSGDVSLYGGTFTYSNSGPNDFSGSVIGGLARANIWVGSNMSLQFDLGGDNSFSSSNNDCSDCNYSVVNLAAHASVSRNPAGLLGVFGSIGYNGWEGNRYGTLGLEAQTYMGPLQLYGQIGASANLTDSPDTAVYGHGEARYFVNPNLMLAANLGLAQRSEYGTTITAVRWGLDAEMKLNNSPFGGFLSYQGSSEREPDESETAHVHTFLAGMKIHLGNSTLQSAAQAGATLKDFNLFTGVNHLRFSDWQ